ncbi:MAG: VWA domain-containing protein [Candidatus Aenigmarchaeota archaeon]|nr:VWA domain-containing protein [Candidatus Aenigmarchaeota archaeon]
MNTNKMKAYVGAVGATKLTAIIVMACILGVFAVSMASVFAESNAQIYTTDIEGIAKLDFTPDSIVYIHGTSFSPNSSISITLTRPGQYSYSESCGPEYCDISNIFGGPPEIETGFDAPQTSNEEGDFVYRYDLDGIVGEYTVTVTDGADVKTFVFTDARNINWAKLNGTSTVTVLPSTSITASVNVTTTSTDHDWKCTKYKIEGGSNITVNHGNHYGQGTYIESFSITAPATPGIYDVSFWAFDDNDCTSGQSIEKKLVDGITVTSPAICGNGVKEGSEGCDDGNTANGDGCNSGCQVETGWACTGTQPSVCTPACGNGIITSPETCDDGNTASSDGCSNVCQTENGWTCTGTPSVCTVANQNLTQSCGIDMALVIDVSGSIDSTELAQMKTALNSFVDAFLPNTPTKIAVIKFDTTATVIHAYSNDATSLKNAINGASGGGYTNWQDALLDTHSLYDHRIDKPDLYVFASDGEPNRYGDPAVSATTPVAVAHAVTEANHIKLHGIRIITLGIGTGGSSSLINNLKAISSNDAYYDTNFETIADDLADLANDLCGGTINVQKFVDGNTAADWQFAVTGGTSNPPSGYTGTDGFITFDIDTSGGNATVSVTETVQNGNSFTSAHCYSDSQHQNEVGTPGQGTVVSIQVGANDAIYCEFNNHHNVCSEYSTEGSCNAQTGLCTWCPQCNQHHQWSSLLGGDQCVPAGACPNPYTCEYGECGAECEDDERPCTAYCDQSLNYYGAGICGNDCTCNYPSPTPCDDGDKCTTDGCSNANGCAPHEPVDCNDNNICTIDSCDPSVGCSNVRIPTETSCTDQIDNDCDGKTDCADTDCAGTPTCFYQRPCDAPTDICQWNKVLPLGSENCCGCNLGFNTYWPLNTQASAECTFTADANMKQKLYISVNNDVIRCTLNGNVIFENQQHEGCAEINPRNGYTVPISPTAGVNTIICEINDRGSMTHFDACVVEKQCFNNADCDNGLYCDGIEYCDQNNQCQPGTPADCSDQFFCTVNERCEEGTSTYECLSDPLDCSGNDIQGIATCTNDPDNYAWTFDFRSLFTSICDDDNNVCTSGSEDISHTCADANATDGGPVILPQGGVSTCTAECDSYGTECQPYLNPANDYCYYNGQCNTNPTVCQCAYSGVPCPDPGYIDENRICHYGERSCTANGCVYRYNDPMGCKDICDPVLGPQDTTGPITDILKITPNPTCGKISFNATITENCTNISDGLYAIDIGIDFCPFPGYGGYQVLPLDDSSYDGDKMQELVGKINLMLTGYNDGRHTLYVRGKNTDGTWGNCDSYGFALDTLAPATESQSITPNMACGSNPYFVARICDPFNESGMCGAEYYIDDFTQGNGEGIPMYPVDGQWNDACEYVYAWVDISQVSEGTHYIKAHGIDCTGCNWGKIENFAPVWFIKDTVAPVSTKTVGTPKIQCSSDVGECWFITQGTEITMNAQDSDPGFGEYSGNLNISSHYPYYQGYVNIYYRQRWKENYDSEEWGTWSSWTLYTGPFKFTEDSLHEIEYYSTDACANNETSKFELDIVDTQPPETAKDVLGPKVAGDGNPIHYYITDDSTIKLTCTDPQPHPVDQVTLNWAVYYSENCTNPTWSSEPIMSGHEQGGYKEITNLQDSCHKIVYSCVDALNNVETEHVEIDAVDNKYPLVEKAVDEPKVPYTLPIQYMGTEPFDVADQAWYVNQNTLITLTCTDQLPHPVDDVKIYYKYYVDGVQHQNWTEYTAPFTYNEDTYHNLYYYCVDALGNKGPTHVELDVVDTQAPTSVKTLTGAKHACTPEEASMYGIADCSFITHDTKVELSCTDGNPHPVDDVELHYKIEWKLNWEGSWQTLRDQTVEDNYTSFYYEDLPVEYQDSFHKLTWYCVDALDNTESQHVELDIVDTQAPQTVKTVSMPKYAGPIGSGIDYYITKDTVINLTCTDGNPHPVDHVTLNWKIYWSSECGPNAVWSIDPIASGAEGDGNVLITNLGDSCHKLVYNCVDQLGNAENTQVEIDAVDNQAPIGTKNVGQPNVPCVGEVECTQFDYWVRDHVTTVTLDCTDAQPHPIGGELMCYKMGYDVPATPDLTQQYCTQFGGKMEADGYCCVDVDGSKNYVFNFTEDSVHTLGYYCKDAFGNANGLDTETFKVDSIAPNTTKTYEGPFYTDGKSDWIDTVSTVKLTATDGGEICHVDGTTTYYAVTQVNESFCYDPAANCQQMHTYEQGVWNTYTSAFPVAESCHLIEFYSVDVLGNKEPIKHQCVFSDHTAPATNKTYGTPLVEAVTGGYPKWITSATPITLTAEDQLPHPSGLKETKYRVTLVNDLNCYEACNAESIGAWNTYTVPFTITEDSCHMIEYFSIDNVQKTEPVKKQCIFVDNKAPISNKTFDGFNVPCSELTCRTEGSCDYYINQNTKIILSCTDQLPHPVDDVKIYYKYTVDDQPHESYSDWTLYTAPIQYNEDSKHTLEWYCEDALGNREQTHTQIERVDTTPPTTVKTFSKPTYPEDLNQNGTIDNEQEQNYWVTSDTAITLTTTDGGPICAAGSSKLYYTVKWDKNCDGDFNDFGEVVINNQHVHVNATTCELKKTLYLEGECLHEIRWHAVDALGNVETEHVQQHKVDNSPPHILILKPVDGWYSKGEDIPAIAEVKDLNSADSPCEQFRNNCNELGENCAVGIEDGAQCYAFLVNLEFLNMNPMEIFDLSDVTRYNLETNGTLLYNAAAQECQGYAVIPENSDVQSGIHIFVVEAEDSLGNYANSIDEIRLAIDQACGGGCWSSDPYDLCEPQCVEDVLQDIITTWNLPKIGIDTNAPEVVITAPVDTEGYYVDKGQLAVSADVTESGITCAITSGTPCYVKIDGTSIGTLYYDNNEKECTGTLVVPEDVPNGMEVPLTVEVSDNCGNIGKGVVYVTVDTMNPAPVILAAEDVENPPYDTDGNYDLVWTGGTDTNFKQFDIVIDGTTYYDVTQPYEGLSAEGRHTYKVIATDEVDKIATSNEVVVWVDTVAPGLDVTGSTPNMGFFLFTYTAIDPNPSSGMQPLQVIGGFGGICSNTLPAGFCMVAGTNDAILKACDNAGNCVSHSTEGTETDVTPPSIIYSSPSGKIEQNEELKLEVTTNEPAYCYYGTEDNWATMTQMSTSVNIDHSIDLPSPLADGLYVYHVQCRDFAGNIMDSSKTIVFYVNTDGQYCYSTDMTAGWNTFFLPQLILDDINFNCGYEPYETADVLGSLEGKYSIVWYYDESEGWLFYTPQYPEFSTLTQFSDQTSNPYYIKMTGPAKLGLQCEDECVSNYCGDGQVNGDEQCELPDDNNNEYCTQTTQQCYQDTHKTQYRDAYGYCDESCGCMEDQEWGSPQCLKDSCGATCGGDSDCSQGQYCNTEICQCMNIPD